VLDNFSILLREQGAIRFHVVHCITQ